MSKPRTWATAYRWILGLAALAAAIALWPGTGSFKLDAWIMHGSLAALAVIVFYLAIATAVGLVDFLPVVVLMAYLTLGRSSALAVAATGLVAGGLIRVGTAWNRLPYQEQPWWEKIGLMLQPLGPHTAALLLADLSFRTLNAQPPLTSIDSLQGLLPVVCTLVVYLLGLDILLLIDMALGRRENLRLLPTELRAVLAVQVLPLVIAPLAAIARSRLGLAAFLLFELVVATIALVVNRLTYTQERLQEQVGHLRMLTTMSQAIRTSLDLDELLKALYVQVAGLLKVRNLMVVLGQPDENNATRWAARYIAEQGVQVSGPTPRPLDGFSMRVIRTRDPLLAESVEATATALRVPDPPPARSWVGVPLRSSRVQGCISVWLTEGQQPGRVFSKTDIDLLTTIAVQTEVAIENALLYEAAQQHAVQLARLNQISTVMNAALKPEKLLTLVAESVIEVAGCHKAAIYLLDPGRRDPELRLTQVQGFSPAYTVENSRNLPAPLTPRERQHVLTEGKILAVPEIRTREELISPAVRQMAETEHIAAYAYLPLRAQQQEIGMLAVYYSHPHPFPDKELELLETFANQAALAVANARIYQQVDVELTRRVGQITRMSDISQRLGSSLDLEVIFRLILDSALEGCKGDAGVLVLSGNPEQGYEPDNSQPHMVAWRGFDPTSTRRAPHRIAEELAQSDILTKGATRLISNDDPAFSGPRSHMAVPIFLESHVIGAIVLESDLPLAFNEEDLSFVSQLAVQAAVAIRNAQLYRHVQIVRDRLHAILDTSNDGLLMIDSKLRIVMTNTRMRDFWDFARQDFKTRTPDQFIADPLGSLGEGLGYKEGELNSLVKEGITNPNMRGRTDLYTTRPTPGQRQRFVERTVTPVRDERGTFIGLLLLFRDVTEQKELEETRQNLTSMIVHELRSPLQAVMGSMRLIAEVTPGNDPVVEQATDVSQRAIKKLLNLVNNLLDLSRMEQGEFVLDTNIEGVASILQDAAEELKPLANEMGAVIRIEAAENLPYVRADRDMIGRVVLNLLDNALKYTDPGTLVTLGAELYRRPQPDGLAPTRSGTRPLNLPVHKEDMIAVWVRDSGPGIPDEYKDAIFDRYAMIPGRKGRRRSAGLGLAFCKIAVESHGGRIWVEDNPGGGSIFRFTLPVGAPPDGAADEHGSEVGLRARLGSGRTGSQND
jgi:PAS domain S-box-containing protein